MPRSITALKSFALRRRERLLALRHSHRARRVALICGIVLVVYALLGFFAVPALLHHWVDTRAAAQIGRPVSVGALRFNPFTLKLGADQLHIGEADGHTPFVDIDQVTLNGSWSSLFRFAPVLDEVTLLHPRIAISRSAAQRFNFSDLIERFAGAPAKTDAQPARFSLSNIVVHAGDIRFDDNVLNASHHVENIEVGIPFIANLPRDTDVFVQPLLAMSVDGSPLRIQGQTKPFANSLESTIDFELHRFDLPRYLSYVPTQLPVAIPRGQLSGNLQLRFIESKAAPQLTVSGTLIADDFAMTDNDHAPIVEIGHAKVELADVQPLISRYRLGAVHLNETSLHYTLRAGGHSNFDALIGKDKPTDGKAAKAAPSEVAIANLALNACRFDYTDTTIEGPAIATFEALAGSISNLNTLNGAAAVDVTATLNGGQLATRGKLDIAAGNYTGTLNAKDVGLAPLQALAAPNLVAIVQQGRVDTTGSFVSDWHSVFNLHIEPATFSARDVAVGQRGKAAQISWRTLDVALTRFDLAAAEASHGDVVLHGLVINAQRGRDGKFDLGNLGDSTPTSAKPVPATKSTAPGPTWHWNVARFVLDNGAINLIDLSADKPVELAIKGIKGELSGLSDKLQQPFKVALSGTIGKGDFDVNGTVQAEPLKTELKIKTRELDLAGMQPYVEVPLNVRVAHTQLTSDGQLHYAGGAPIKLSYRGRAALNRLRLLDKLSGEDFLTLRTLSFTAIDLKLDEGPLHLSLGDIGLSDFYVRVIMNANGRLNLADVAGRGAEQPVSVTQAEDASKPAAPAAPAPVATTNETTTVVTTNAPPASTNDIQIGTITLTNGRLNYTDYFIKPNYSADITQLTGKVGAFGTHDGPPAMLTLQGQLDNNAPVTIDGSINPLAPVAFADIKGKAVGIELTHLSTYSSTYTGYPIEKGRLNADVSYHLEQRKLKADNHMFIDQLTFGERIESPGASHLPVKLAVALLKNSRGEIDVNVPVSGSLDDPQFSLSGLVWRAFGNLIAKAATAPFRLLAAALGGGGGDSAQDLGYVEFAPGSAALDDAGKTKLAQIVTALTDRPSLNLDIIGRLDSSQDETGLRRVMVDDLIHKEWVDDKGAKATDASADSSAIPPTLTPEETQHYLERAYKHADFAKEHNLIGLTKSQPSEVMRQMLETNMPVDENALRQLAQRRADTVRNFLQGKIDDKRLFVLAPKLDAKGIEDEGKTTRVDFSLH
jgi:hypothetical protein